MRCTGYGLFLSVIKLIIVITVILAVFYIKSNISLARFLEEDKTAIFEFSPDGTFLAVGHSDDGLVELKNVVTKESRRLRVTAEEEYDHISVLKFVDTYLISGTEVGKVEVYDIDTNEVKTRISMREEGVSGTIIGSYRQKSNTSPSPP